jgi:hypothetical protein
MKMQPHELAQFRPEQSIKASFYWHPEITPEAVRQKAPKNAILGISGISPE